ncbi:MAG: NIPSNAP family protein [Candidatus Hodarchaeota archaeon]
MIYLEEILNILPAHPENLDKFVDFAKEKLVPVCERLGTRLVTAWFSTIEWFIQVTHIFEFENMDALKDFRIKTSQDKQWGEYAAKLEDFAPERRSRLLEPIGAIPPENLHKAIEESQIKALKVYSMAILEVTPNKMTEFIEGVKLSSKIFPIIASWRPIAGSPNEVIDIWKGAIGFKNYQPAVEGMKEWFRRLREIAPKERLVQIFPLPYSQLK